MRVKGSNVFKGVNWRESTYIYIYSIMTSAINPLHPNIKMHILHTVLYKFPKVVIRRICLSCWDHFLYSCCVCVWFRDADIERRNKILIFLLSIHYGKGGEGRGQIELIKLAISWLVFFKDLIIKKFWQTSPTPLQHMLKCNTWL